MNSTPPAFACNMDALTLTERMRHVANTAHLMKTLRAVREDANGYSFQFANETQVIRKIAEFVSLERLCCPFFDFTLQVKAEDASVSLQIAGAQGIKDFIRTEFSEAIP
jgi:hypothetical protein